MTLDDYCKDVKTHGGENIYLNSISGEYSARIYSGTQLFEAKSSDMQEALVKALKMLIENKGRKRI